MYSGAANLPPNRLNGFCPICLGECSLYSGQGKSPSVAVCRLCGEFRFNWDPDALQYQLHKNFNSRLYKISHQLRTTSEEAVGIKDKSLCPVYEYADFVGMAHTPNLPVADKAILLLRGIAVRSRYPGDVVPFELGTDYSIVAAQNADEALFHLTSLASRGLLSTHSLGGSVQCSVTNDGWDELERIAQSGADSPQGFIAMWFDPTQDEVKEMIHQAVRDSGFTPIRIDAVEHVNRIDDEIIARIRSSRFLVADLTGGRAGVYFEAGFMIGLGRPVIWLCHEDDLKSVHFDTRQYNMIVYTDLEILRKKLNYRIEAILGKGPIVAPNDT